MVKVIEIIKFLFDYFNLDYTARVARIGSKDRGLDMPSLEQVGLIY